MVYSFKNILWEVALSWRKSCKMHSWGSSFLTVSCQKQRKNIYNLRPEKQVTNQNFSLSLELLVCQIPNSSALPSRAVFELQQIIPMLIHSTLMNCPNKFQGRPEGNENFLEITELWIWWWWIHSAHRAGSGRGSGVWPCPAVGPGRLEHLGGSLPCQAFHQAAHDGKYFVLSGFCRGRREEGRK